MQTTLRKIQTAFRLDEGLLARMKLRARRENKSLNRWVEENLERLAPVEPEWPIIEFPLKNDPFYEKMQLKNPIPQEDIDADERLAYILGK